MRQAPGLVQMTRKLSWEWGVTEEASTLAKVGVVLHFDLLKKKSRSAFYFHQQRVFWDSRSSTRSKFSFTISKNKMPPLGIIGIWERLSIVLIPISSCSTSAEKKLCLVLRRITRTLCVQIPAHGAVSYHGKSAQTWLQGLWLL